MATAGIDHVTTLPIDHVGLEGPGWLFKLPECLTAHARPWNPEVPALGVASHFAKALGNANDNTSPSA